MRMQNASGRFKRSAAVAIVATALLSGYGLGRGTSARQETAPPAYLVVSSDVINPEAMGRYGAAAGPLAAVAGVEVLAGRPDPTVTVLEGDWPYAEGIVIERFNSMSALKDFWFSDSYQEAKKLRAGALKVNFIVAVEGVPVAD